jgi:hypothetical protein
MKEIFKTSAQFMIMVSLLLTGCKTNPKSVTPETVQPTREQLIQKGEYLVKIIGCNDCHSPKKMGPQGPEIITDLMLSGYQANRIMKKVDSNIIKDGWILFVDDLTATAGPWGISFSANLTSDQTGIGNWTEENFKRALKEGKYKGLEGSRTLLPPMPWEDFASMSDAEAKAIFTFLMSTKPVKNIVPLPVAPEEANK